MQEYFAAVRVLEGAPITELAREEKWREVLGAATGLASDQDDFVAKVLASNVITAAHCVALGSEVQEDTVDRVVIGIVSKLDGVLSLEASFAKHMETNAFSSWGSVEMANDAMESAVDRLYKEVDPRLVPALREMGEAGLAALERLAADKKSVYADSASQVRDYLKDPRPHRTEGRYLSPGAFGNRSSRVD